MIINRDHTGLVLADAICRFCDSVLLLRGDNLARQGFESTTVGILKSFFEWFLLQKIGKDGRKKRGIKTRSSLETMWKLFRLVFEREMGEKLHPKMNRKMHKVREATPGVERRETAIR